MSAGPGGGVVDGFVAGDVTGDDEDVWDGEKGFLEVEGC